MIYCILLKISSFCFGSKDNKFDSMTLSFDSSTDYSLLEVFFSKKRYLIVSPLITHLRVPTSYEV